MVQTGVMRGAAAGRVFENDYNEEDGARRVGAGSGRENEGKENAGRSMLFIRGRFVEALVSDDNCCGSSLGLTRARDNEARRQQAQELEHSGTATVAVPVMLAGFVRSTPKFRASKWGNQNKDAAGWSEQYRYGTG